MNFLHKRNKFFFINDVFVWNTISERSMLSTDRKLTYLDLASKIRYILEFIINGMYSMFPITVCSLFFKKEEKKTLIQRVV